MSQQTRITPGMAMRVRDVSRPRDDQASADAGAPGTDGESGTPQNAETQTPPTSRKGERRRLRRLRKNGGQG
ncbi:hypothetical protein ABGB12_00580 [Actinocorallia sp. B10E7]|uniref:hypothetical protein n=1 Tax=Actinocorallia sp. B10E7 TaxID=3153558 RepID=UPI00325DF291